MSARSVIFAGGLCLVLALAGCGGKSSAAGGGTGAFIKSADRICTTYYDGVYSMAAPVDEAQVERFIATQRALRERERRELEALSSPLSLASGYKKYLRNIATLNRLVATLVQELFRRHQGNRQAMKQAEKLQTSVYEEAGTLGLTNCAKNPYTATHYAK